MQVAELNILLNDLQSVATFFRTSGVHACELQGTAQECFPQITLLHFPQFKEVRFAEFTANLLRAFVRNIPICLHYWKHLSESNESNHEEKNKSKGFLNIWLSKDKLQLVHVYLDIAEIVQSLQMQFQNKQLTILEVEPARDSALAKIKQMLDKPKAGGYEAKILEQVEDDKFHGFPLLSERSRRATNRFVTFPRDFEAIRLEILMSIHNFLQERLETDDTTKRAKVFDPASMTRYLEISTKQEFLETYGDDSVQKLVEDAMPDLNVGLVMNEWTDCKALLSGTPNLDSYSFAELVTFISKAGKKGLLQASNLLMLLARILVMSPHSMYVEFAISAYNLIKDDH